LPAQVKTSSVQRHDTATHPIPPSLGGGAPAQGRVLGRQGRQTVRKLLEAGLAEFDERGFQAVTVDDVVRRASTSHGTFYLYFASKEDLFRTLLRDALAAMHQITDEFPVVTANDRGKAALRSWVSRFFDVYAEHGTVLRVLSQGADVVGEDIYGDGLQVLFRLAETITQGMTAGASAGTVPDDDRSPIHAELTAVACLMMLERINYLLVMEIELPREDLIDRLTAITYAAFHAGRA
jgi:AcrR family transcriptional regulator